MCDGEWECGSDGEEGDGDLVLGSVLTSVSVAASLLVSKVVCRRTILSQKSERASDILACDRSREQKRTLKQAHAAKNASQSGVRAFQKTVNRTPSHAVFLAHLYTHPLRTCTRLAQGDSGRVCENMSIHMSSRV